MIKNWQSMQDYHSFFHNAKVYFDPSERSRLHNELWEPWQKLHFFNTDKAMEFFRPFYSSTGRPAQNQPQNPSLFYSLFPDVFFQADPWLPHIMGETAAARSGPCCPYWLHDGFPSPSWLIL